jgi:hypothetical protein
MDCVPALARRPGRLESKVWRPRKRPTRDAMRFHFPLFYRFPHHEPGAQYPAVRERAMQNVLGTINEDGGLITAQATWSTSHREPAAVTLQTDKQTGGLLIAASPVRPDRSVTVKSTIILNLDKMQASALRDWLIANLPA